MVKEIREKLLAPFEDTDIEWRLQWCDKDKLKGLAVPYVNNRAIQTRLDAVVGIDGWKNTFLPWHSVKHADNEKQSQLCGISIRFETGGEWITKYDGAEDSDIEAAKGGISDAMKRAAVQWGIGRYLYGMEAVYVDAEKQGKTYIIKKTERQKLDKAHSDFVQKAFGSPIGKSMSAAPAGKSDAKSNVSPRQETLADKSDAKNSDSPIQETPAGKNNAKSNISPLTKTPASKSGSYRVVDITAHEGAKSGRYSNIRLQDMDGEITQVCIQGEKTDLAPGIVIRATITDKIIGEVVFHILDAYSLVEKAA